MCQMCPFWPQKCARDMCPRGTSPSNPPPPVRATHPHEKAAQKWAAHSILLRTTQSAYQATASKVPHRPKAHLPALAGHAGRFGRP